MYEDYTMADVLEHEELINRYDDGELDEFFTLYEEDYDESESALQYISAKDLGDEYIFHTFENNFLWAIAMVTIDHQGYDPFDSKNHDRVQEEYIDLMDSPARYYSEQYYRY